MNLRFARRLAAVGAAIGALLTTVTIAGNAGAIPVGGDSPNQLPNSVLKLWSQQAECVDNDTERSFVVQIYHCHSASAQLWDAFIGADPLRPDAYTFVSQANTAECITAVGLSVSLTGCNLTDPNQEWIKTFGGTSTQFPGVPVLWRNVATNNCLYAPSTADHTVLVTSGCDSTVPREKWILTHA